MIYWNKLSLTTSAAFKKFDEYERMSGELAKKRKKALPQKLRTKQFQSERREEHRQQ